MAYLAISAITKYFSGRGVQVNKQKGIRDITLEYSYYSDRSWHYHIDSYPQESFRNNQDLFRKQLAAFYGLAGDLWEQLPSWDRTENLWHGERPQSERGTYPKFYQDILNKIDSSPKKQEDHEMFLQYLKSYQYTADPPVVRHVWADGGYPRKYIEGNAIDVTEWLYDSINKDIEQAYVHEFIRAIIDYRLSIADVDTLMNMFSLREPQITGKWEWIKKQAGDVLAIIAVQTRPKVTQPWHQAGEGKTQKQPVLPRKAAFEMKEQPIEDSRLGQWTETFRTKVGNIVHEPTAIIMGGMRCGKEFNMQSKSWNGVTLKAPLILKVNSTREQFISAMRASGIMG